MLKYILLLAITFFSLTSIHATEFLKRGGSKSTFTLDVSPKASFGNAIFLNPNVDADPYANRVFFSPTWLVGGRAGLSIMASVPRYLMFTVYGEYMIGSMAQNFQLRDYSKTTVLNYDHGYKMSTQTMAAIFRMTIFTGDNHDNALYFEVGKQTNVLSAISETNSINTTDLNTATIPSYTPASRFNTNLNNLVFGLGGHGFMYSLGLRCTYGLNSLMTNKFNPVDDGHFNNLTVNTTDYTKYYSSYKETRLLSIELVLEINLYLLELGNATCGKKRFFFFPFHLNNEVMW